MSLMFSDDRKEIIITCGCGCEEAIHFRIEPFDWDKEDYAFITYLNGNFYRDQNESIIRVIAKKLKKIWAIIRNKDYTYSDVMLSESEFDRFREYVNSIGDTNITKSMCDVRAELQKHEELYNGFLASIKSALKEVNSNEDKLEYIAEYILDWIIG